MSVFLIDYENVRTSAFNGLEDLTEEDRVIVFYTANSDNLTFSLMQRLCGAKARIDYLKVACGGKNSLDFQLCSYLGYLIGTYKDTRFCIISRDKGFFTMLSLWGENTENGNSVICCTNIFNGNGRKPIEESETTESSEEYSEKPVEEPEASEPTIAEAETEHESESEIPEVSPAEETPAEEKPAEEKPAEEKPKRTYKRRTYKRKPKAAAEQSA